MRPRRFSAANVIRSLCAFPLVAFALCFAVGPALAEGATLTVNDDTAGPGPAGTDCTASPDFNSVQAAIDAAATNDTIAICAGTYVEQPDIDKTLTLIGAGDATVVRSPATADLVSRYKSPAPSITEWQPVVHVAADNVIVRDLQIDGANQGNVNGNYIFLGIWALNHSFELHDSLVTNVQKTPFDGVQTGFAVRQDNTDGASRTVVIDGNRLTNYQKGGIVVRGLGLDGTIRDNDIVGVGAQTDIAQNGISFGRGMSGVIEGNEIRDHLCNQATCGADPATQTQSAGLIMVATAGPQGGDVVIEGNTFADNDTGLLSSVSDGSLRTVSGNMFEANRYIGLYVEDGHLEATANRISDNPRGVVAVTWPGGYIPDLRLIGNDIFENARGVSSIQAGGASIPPIVSAHHNRIVGNTTAGVDNTSTAEFNFENNWWGCNEGPNQPGCDNALGPVDWDPWLVLKIAATPTSLEEGDESQITATITHNSEGLDVGTEFPDGQPMGFATDFGTVSPASAPTASGIAQSTLSSDEPGEAVVQATLDNETVSTEPIVFAAAPPAKGCSNVIPGTPGNDDLIGTAGRDSISGKDGFDKLRGAGGRDCLRGGNDDDLVKGGYKADQLGGGSGQDLLRGQGGADELKGGRGVDRFQAGAGNDTVRSTGGTRGELVDCGEGKDTAVVDEVDSVVACERVRRV